MGWYADSDWSLTVMDPTALAADITATAQTTLATVHGTSADGVRSPIVTGSLTELAGAHDDPFTVIADAIRLFNEDGDVTFTAYGAATRITAWGGGKAYLDPGLASVIVRRDGFGNEPYFSYNGGMDLLTVFSRHGVGRVDWRSEDTGHWRWRLHGDGTWSEYDGEVIYPRDAADMPGLPARPSGARFTCPTCGAGDGLRADATVNINDPLDITVLDGVTCHSCGTPDITPIVSPIAKEPAA